MAPQISKIQDYAIIGNGRSAALISKQGAIDWLCWPRFDSASIFGAIIDPRIGGHWSIHPADDSQIARRYIDNTNVLETTFSNSSGIMVLTDFMPVTSERKKAQRLWPEHELVRLLTCKSGEVPVVINFDPRPDYGRITPLIKDEGKLGWCIEAGRTLLNLRSDISLATNASGGLQRCRFVR
jgi:GH15 family glucan-1,4-alpha-glucosidase